MARPNVGEFTAYMTAAGIGLVLAGVLFGADPCAFGPYCRASIWDFFFGMGSVLIGVGGPITLMSNAHQYLMA